MARPTVPTSLSQWNTFAGGTSAAAGKHGYDARVTDSSHRIGYQTFTIQPISSDRGRHLGYRLTVYPGTINGHETVGGYTKLYRSPQQAVSAARVWAAKNIPGTGMALLANPRRGKFQVMTSFGGKVLSSHSTMAAAERGAVKASRTTPVDVWNQSIRVGHFMDGKGQYFGASNPRRIRLSQPKAGQRVQIAGGSGLASDKQGKVLHWMDPKAKPLAREYPFVGGRTPSGMGWVAVELDDGSVTTVPANRLILPGSPAYGPVRQNPVVPSALPSKWTPATITRRGRQIQIRVGRGR